MFKSTLKLDSKIFSAAGAQKAFSSVAIESANKFRQDLKQKMIDSVPQGRVDIIGEGKTFRARFRRSARGQRPAIQTRELLNSIYARRVNENSAKTIITAEYAERLQSKKFGRLLMTDADQLMAEKDFIERGKKALLDLLN